MEVDMARISLAAEISAIRRSFSALAEAFERLGPALAERQVELAAGRVSTNGADSMVTRRRSPRLTAKRRAELKIQGKYLGTMRGLRPGQRAAIKKLRAEKGIQVALKEALRLAG